MSEREINPSEIDHVSSGSQGSSVVDLSANAVGRNLDMSRFDMGFDDSVLTAGLRSLAIDQFGSMIPRRGVSSENSMPELEPITDIESLTGVTTLTDMDSLDLEGPSSSMSFLVDGVWNTPSDRVDSLLHPIENLSSQPPSSGVDNSVWSKENVPPNPLAEGDYPDLTMPIMRDILESELYEFSCNFTLLDLSLDALIQFGLGRALNTLPDWEVISLASETYNTRRDELRAYYNLYQSMEID